MPRHPDRIVRLSGASNFRDLGGYHGQGGRPLRWRRLFRSDHLGALSASDHQVLSGLGVAASLDFRGVDERAAAPYEMPGLTQHALSIEPTVTQRMEEITMAGAPLTTAVVEGLMRDLYRGLIRRQAHRFAEFFRHLLQAEAPVVFHCTAGKDRTGVAAALLLLALGVPRKTVMADYLLTNEFYRPPWANADGMTPQASQGPLREPLREPLAQQALWGVQPSYLEAAWQVLEQEFGGLDPFLTRQVGLDTRERETLIERFLQEARDQI